MLQPSASILPGRKGPIPVSLVWPVVNQVMLATGHASASIVRAWSCAALPLPRPRNPQFQSVYSPSPGPEVMLRPTNVC